MSLMQRVEADSVGYPGHNAPWQPPVSWNREGQGIVVNAKDMFTAATSAAGNGKHLQLIQYAVLASCRLSLTSRSIEYYRERLLSGAHSTSPKPLCVPKVGNQTRPSARFPHMLPAVARMVISEWGELSGLLHAALAEVPAATLQGGHGGGSPTKAQVKAERDAAEQRAATAEKRAASAEKQTTKAKKEAAKAKKAAEADVNKNFARLL